MHMIFENHLSALGALVQDRMAAGFGGLSPSASAILLTLANRGPLPVSEIAAILGVAQPTASRLLDGLARDGLVARGEKRGRQVSVAPTRAGAQRARALQRGRMALAADLLAPLDPRERDNPVNLLLLFRKRSPFRKRAFQYARGRRRGLDSSLGRGRCRAGGPAGFSSYHADHEDTAAGRPPGFAALRHLCGAR